VYIVALYWKKEIKIWQQHLRPALFSIIILWNLSAELDLKLNTLSNKYLSRVCFVEYTWDVKLREVGLEMPAKSAKHLVATYMYLNIQGSRLEIFSKLWRHHEIRIKRLIYETIEGFIGWVLTKVQVNLIKLKTNLIFSYIAINTPF